jgi:hypothetical protein
VIVIFGVLIIALPIAGFFVSSGWNAKIKAAAEETLSSKKRLVEGVSQVTYSLPPVVAGEQAVEERRAPNAAVTAYFAAKRAERQAAIEGVVTRAVRSNKTADREVLMPGLLPGMEDSREQRRKAKELAGMIVGDDETPSVYAPLFESINAGKPVAKEDVARRVVDAYRSEIDRAGDEAMDEAETSALGERMKGHRYGVMARRAEEISVYASVDALLGADPLAYSEIPSEVPSGTLDETDALRWQMDYWLVQDLLRAVDLANRTDDGLATEVPRSPVKRIVSIRLSQLDIPTKPEEGAKPAAATTDPGQRRGGLRPPANPFQNLAAQSGAGGAVSTTVTHTGRKSDDKNGVFLIRHATVTVVASSDELVRVLESFGEANFMTVTGVDLTEIDRWADMDEGYYYGPDHVVRAEIEIEAAYLHFWLADVVPGYVASAWGIEKTDPQTDAAP